MVARQTASTPSHRHRSTGMKQQNKSFKSRHASKGTLKVRYKEEKVAAIQAALAQRRGKNSEAAFHKAQKKNHSKLVLQNKRDALRAVEKIFSGPQAAPKVIAVVPLCPDVDPLEVVNSIARGGVVDPNESQPALCTPTNVYLESHRQNLKLIPVPRDVLSIMDACSIADFIIFVVSAVVEVDDIGEACMSIIKAQSVPKVLGSVLHLDQVPTKQQPATRKALFAYLEHHFPDSGKVYDLDVSSELSLCMRFLAQNVPKSIAWRDRHSYMSAQVVDHTCDENGTGYLHVTGHVRGSSLSPNNLLHIPNFGDFQIAAIEILRQSPTSKSNGVSTMNVDENQMLWPDESQEPLISANDVDNLDQEQTWPTEEELKEADERVKNASSRKVIVPKGTSSYQAAWISDGVENADEDYEDDDDMNNDGDMDMKSMGALSDDEKTIVAGEILNEGEEIEEVELENTSEIRNEREEQLDDEDDEEEYQEYIKRKHEETDDVKFPDEVEVPLDVMARVRFQKYRGLKNFRHSEWDPYENLPLDYARIFEFQQFRAAKKGIFAQVNRDGAEVGSLVKIVVKNVSREVYEAYAGRYLPLFAIMKHEHKMSVMHFSVMRNPGYTAPVRSKDRLLLVCGFRRYMVNPIFSDDTRNTRNNVHRFERYLQQGRPTIATVFCPIQFDPAPAMLFKVGSTNTSGRVGAGSLVASGTVIGSDPTRIVAKRIVLTGHPFKCNPRSTVVRYMFHNVHDINYFKPVQLRTKHGRVGHIKESLGTRGYMKCTFDRPLTQMDTVCMHLYKRVFPKWTTALYSATEDVAEDTMAML